MSPPAQKCAPAPCSSTTRVLRSSAAAATAAVSAAIVSRFTALRISGRFKVISKTPSRRWTITLGIAWLLVCASVYHAVRFSGDDTMSHTIVRGGLVLDIAKGNAETADILIEDDTNGEIGPPGGSAPEGAVEITAARRLLHPGLVNAHTHGHGNLAKGMGDRWTLELLLSAAPWITGNRNAEEKYLSTQLGAVEMVLKGSTACYDLSFEWPLPTADGLKLAGQAYV